MRLHLPGPPEWVPSGFLRAHAQHFSFGSSQRRFEAEPGNQHVLRRRFRNHWRSGGESLLFGKDETAKLFAIFACRHAAQLQERLGRVKADLQG